MQKNRKVCIACNFLCFDIEEICPRCGAYTFKKVTDEEITEIPEQDKKLDLENFL